MKLIASVFILWVVVAGNIFAETSTSAKNPYVEERLSNEEKALYYKDPLKYMESLAITSDYRALELSLYYQGWAPEVVFFRFDEKISPILLAIPTKKEMTQNVKMRDKEKARYWAEKHTCGRYFREILAFCNLSNLLYSKNPTAEEAKEFYFRCFLFYHSLDSSWDDEIYGCGSVYAHALHKGTMDVPVDLEAFHKILTRSNHLLWRNFYSGFFAPKDKEFAKYILSLSTDYWDLLALVDIYKGKYDPSDANPEFVKYWQKKADKAKSRFMIKALSLWEQSDGTKRIGKFVYKGKYDPSNANPELVEYWKKKAEKADNVKGKFVGNFFTMWMLKDNWELLKKIEYNKIKTKNPNISEKEMYDLFDKKYNIIKHGAKQVLVRHPYYALRDDVVFEQVNPHYDRKLAEQIIQNILANELYIASVIKDYAYKATLNKYGVDQDLIERLFKKANNGLFDFMSECDSYVPYGYEIFKKRMLNNF
jgi:hypothetical protein